MFDREKDYLIKDPNFKLGEVGNGDSEDGGGKIWITADQVQYRELTKESIVDMLFKVLMQVLM